MPLSDYYPEMQGWKPADNLSPQALPQIPTPEVQVSPFLRATLPLPLQYSGDTIKQYNRPGLSSFRIAPLPPGGIPAINSASTGTATGVVQQAVQTVTQQVAAGDIEEVLVRKLTGTAYTVVDSDRSQLLTFNNSAGGTITLPSGSSGGSNQTFVQANTNDAIGTSVVTTLSGSVVSGHTIVVIASGSKLDGNSYPITGVTDNKGNTYTKLGSDIIVFASGGGQKQTFSVWAATGVTGGASFQVTASTALAGTFLISTALEYTASSVFANDPGSPQFLSGVSSGVQTTPALNTTGGADLLLGIVMYQTTNSSQVTTWGNGFTERVHFFENTTIGYDTSIADKEVTPAGAYAAQATLGISGALIEVAIINGSAATTLFTPGWYAYIENTGPGIFTVSTQALIDGSSNPVNLGPNEGALFAFDGNNWFTVRGIGLPFIPAPRQLFTARSAAIAATTLYAVPATQKGMYRVSYEASITQAATTSSSLGGANGFQVKFTNGNGDSVVKTSNPTTPVVSAANTTGTTISGALYAYCNGGTNLQFLFDYTSVGGTPMQYDLAVFAEYLGS